MALPTLEEQFLADERARIEREREQARQARAAASIAQPANPQRTADVNRLARDVGQPPAVVEEQYDAMTQYRRARAAREAARKQPKLGDWLGDERNAALAQDDVGLLESIGDTVAGWLRSSGVSRQMVDNAERGVFASDAGREDGFFDRMSSLIERGGAAVDEGIYNFIAGTTGSSVARNAARTLSRGTTGQEVAGQTTWEAVKSAPTLSNIGAYIIDAGAESLPAMSALAVPYAGLGLIGTSQTGNIAAERARNNGREEISGRDIALSTGFGFGTAALDRLGLKGIFGGAGRSIGTRIGRAAAGEAGTEFLQSTLEYTGGTVGTQAGFDIATAFDQGLAGAVAGAGMGGGIRSTVEVARSARSIEAVDRLMQRSAESQVRQRDPESFRTLIEQLTGEASDGNLYVSGETIAQFNQDYAEDEFWGQFAEEIDDARLTGGDVAIPLSRAAAELSGRPDWDAIKGDVRAAPGAMTANEIAAAEAEWETIRREAGETLDAQESEARAAAAPGERLRGSIRDTLMSRGMDPDQAAANAEVTAALFETEAANLGYDLTGREFDKAVSVQRVLPGLVADPESADTLDVIVNAMRGGKDAEIGVGSTLMEFIRERGGINDPGGDLASMGMPARLIRDFDPDQGSFGGLSGAGDYGIDSTLRAAIEAGFFPELQGVEAEAGVSTLDTQALLDALGRELAGEPVYAETRIDQMRQAGAELRELLASAGLDPDTASMADIRAAVERFDGGRALEQRGITLDSIKSWAKDNGLEVSLVEREGEIEINMLRSAARGRGVGGEFMARIGYWADQTGARVLLTPEKVGNTSVSRLKAFYKRHGFVENKGRNKDFSTRAGMIREPMRTLDQAFGANDNADGGDILRGFVDFISDSRPIAEKYQAGDVLLVDDRLADVVSGNDTSLSVRFRDDGSEQLIDRRSREITVAPYQLWQRGTGPQGQIQFTEGQALIRLFESANASTFQHEMAHFWLERMFANARQSLDTDGNPAARQTFADVESIKAWFKDNGHPVESDTIPTEAHEMFARAWEQYLMEGKAPTTRLQSAFRKFSRWLKAIYRTVANLNTPITPEIREVMDRMLATEQEIADAAETRAAYLQFDNAIEAGMSETDARRYAELSEQVRSEAEEQLAGKVMRSIRARDQKQYKEQEKTVRAEVAEAVDARPGFAALKLLRQKDGPRIDKAWLQENFGDDVFGILPAGMPVWKQGGTNPDTLAELTGFSSGDQLVRELLGMEARRRELKEGGDQRPLREVIIAQETKMEMDRRFGDPIAAGTIEREANAAIQNDRLGEKTELELRALGSKTNRKPTPYRMAREWARGRIEQGVIADMISGAAQYRYTRTAAKAARDAQAAILAGDMNATFRHKQTEMLHTALAREAAEASDQVDVAVRRLGKFAKQTKAKTLPLDYLDRIHALLEGVEFRQVSQRGLDRRKALRDWIEAEEAEGRTVELPERVLDEIDQKNWSRLTVEELLLLDDAVKQIAALGRLKSKLLTAKKDREVEQAASEMEQAIIASKKGPKPTRTRETLGHRAASAFKSFKAMHRKMASLAREMDSVQDGGPVWDNLIRPMMERFDQEAEMNREATEKLLDILSPFYGRDKLGRPKMGGKGIYFDSIGQSFNLEERMAIVGQMGNAGNLQRLIDGERGEFGFRWSMEQLNEIKASLTKEQMDAVQAIWDLFESYRPLIAAKERRVSGIEPEWVEPTPVETEHGTYKGGYWPIKYDRKRTLDAQQQADAAEAERQMRGAFTAATTQRSFTKSRAARVTNRPLLYSFSGVTQGLTDVVHDLAFHEYLIDANRLLRHPKVSSAMLNYYGPEVMEQFRRGIEDVAAGDTPAQDAWERGINHIRMGATVAGLGWNLKTALLQPFGLTQSIVRVGAPWIARGASQFFASPLETSRAVYERSRFMRERSNTMQREINEIRNRIRGGTQAGEFLNASFFFMITRTQMAIDLPTWQGAYEKAIAEGRDDDMAVSLADQAVRDAQGGGQVGDLSAIQRGGPVRKLFTNFYSFFNTTYNLTAESYARTDFRKPGDVMALALDYLLLYSLPAAMGMLLDEAFAGEDDDGRSWWEKLASEHISYLTGTMVGLREIDAPIQNVGEALTGAELNEYDFGYTGPAGLRFFADGTRAAQQASQGEFDEALRKSMINTGGILFHLPSGQINKTIDGATAIANDDTDNPMALVSGN